MIGCSIMFLMRVRVWDGYFDWARFSVEIYLCNQYPGRFKIRYPVPGTRLPSSPNNNLNDSSSSSRCTHSDLHHPERPVWQCRDSGETRVSVLGMVFDILDFGFTPESSRERWDELVREFETKFGHKPTYIVRAPGRVKFVHPPSFPICVTMQSSSYNTVSSVIYLHLIKAC